MITASQIKDLREKSIDFGETVTLKSELAQLHSEREPFYLTEAEFDKILRWKLRGQYGRQVYLRSSNTDDLIRRVTTLAFSIEHLDSEYKMELRLGILTCLRGVGVPVASAILALVYPDEHAVIDFRGWRQVFGEERYSFSIKDYKRYMDQIRRLANELGWTVQEVDMAIWEYDRNHPGKGF